MPAMHYTVRWPDQTETTCYSPSLVIKDFFVPGQAYPIEDFLKRIREATAIASERVRAKFGFVCSRAGDQLGELEMLSARYIDQRQAQVVMVAFDEAV